MPKKGLLFDMAKCTACRGCQVACKQWNQLPAEKTTFFAEKGGYQNPAALSPHTYSLVKFYEVKADGQLKWLFRIHRCLHCDDPACVKACPVEPVKAMVHDKERGMVYVNKELCIGCGACNDYCPWNIPQIDDDTEKSTKCTFCIDRVSNGLEPACTKACPSGALVYDDYDKILKMAHQAKERLEAEGKHPTIYGEKELGTGTHKITVFPESLDYYPDVIKNPEIPADIGFFHELLKPLGGLTITASVVGLLMARVRDVREKEEAQQHE